uniref:40S ribosomal protein S10 (Trinotate prediction) n=1 Tax=Henneguya salminicola TaxID=69463 RepID=A0A6G3MKS9_HENSL
MHISQENRTIVYETLFNEGVLVAVRDTVTLKHIYLDKVSNLQVMHLMRSLKSRDFITEKFVWNHYYWTLTDKGIEYLRGFLKIPSNCVPGTLKKPERPERGEKRIETSIAIPSETVKAL